MIAHIGINERVGGQTETEWLILRRALIRRLYPGHRGVVNIRHVERESGCRRQAAAVGGVDAHIEPPHLRVAGRARECAGERVEREPCRQRRAIGESGAISQRIAGIYISEGICRKLIRERSILRQREVWLWRHQHRRVVDVDHRKIEALCRHRALVVGDHDFHGHRAHVGVFRRAGESSRDRIEPEPRRQCIAVCQRGTPCERTARAAIGVVERVRRHPVVKWPILQNILRSHRSASQRRGIGERGDRAHRAVSQMNIGNHRRIRVPVFHPHLVARAVINQHVITVAGEGDICRNNPSAKRDEVAVEIGAVVDDGVEAVAAIEHIHVAPGAAIEQIVALAGCQGVVAVAAVQFVIAFVTVEPVADVGAEERVVEFVALHDESVLHQIAIRHRAAVIETKGFDRVPALFRVGRIESFNRHFVAIAQTNTQHARRAGDRIRRGEFQVVAQTTGRDARAELQRVLGCLRNFVADQQRAIATIEHI